MPAARRGRFEIALLVTVSFFAAACLADPPPHVVLITVDTLRADHCGAYGRPPLPTPAFDRIAAAGAVVERAYAPFGRTTQSLGSILTGLHPLRHGADGLGMPLPAENMTLAERFAAHGYRRGAFVSNLWIQPGRGFEQGFELFSNPPPRWERDSAPEITAEALAWARDAERSGEPIFLWVHYLDPHWPYEPPEPWAKRADPDWNGSFDLFQQIGDRRADDHPDAPTKGDVIFAADRLLTPREIEHVRRLYAAEVAATDAAVGTLLDGLQQAGILDDAVVVFTADHGESLGEHRYWFAHGEYLYDETLRVPLFVQAPGVPPGSRLAGNALSMDIYPTLLALAGLPPATAIDGVDLSGALRGAAPGPPADRLSLHLSDHVLVRDENPRTRVPGRAGRWCAARAGAEKLIEIPQADGSRSREFYDLASDPAEQRDRSGESPDVARLTALCAAVPNDGPAIEHSAEDRATAETLGYTGAGQRAPDR